MKPNLCNHYPKIKARHAAVTALRDMGYPSPKFAGYKGTHLVCIDADGKHIGYDACLGTATLYVGIKPVLSRT